MKKVICNQLRYVWVTKAKVYNVLSENEQSYNIINDLGNEAWYPKEIFNVYNVTELLTQEPEILSPSQPNMCVGGWVKCIKNNGLALLGKWYMISHVEINSDGFYVFEIKDEAVCSDYDKNKFQSYNFDCDNALPCNPDDLPAQIHEEIKSTSENNASVPEVDMVNNPPHYNQFPMELKDWNFAVIETIQDKHYAAYFKTVSEYLHRAHLKNGVEDLEKAVFWLQDCIEHVKNKQMEVK